MQGNNVEKPLREQVDIILNTPSSKHDPANLNILCAHIDEQIKTNTYDMDVCLSILRMYIFYPPCLDPEVVRKILIKGAMHLPDSHVTAFLATIPDHHKKDKKIAELIHLINLLEECRFKQVWEYLREGCMSDVNSVPGLVDNLRRFICECIGATYYTLGVCDICSLLNLSSTTHHSEFDRILKNQGWVVEEGPDGDDVRIVSAAVLQASQNQKEDIKKNQHQSNFIHKSVEKSLTTDSLKGYLKHLAN